MTRGGAKTPGPGKKQGRPKSLIKRGKCNFFIRKDLIDWLVDHKPQNMYIEVALDEYIRRFEG